MKLLHRLKPLGVAAMRHTLQSAHALVALGGFTVRDLIYSLIFLPRVSSEWKFGREWGKEEKAFLSDW